MDSSPQRLGNRPRASTQLSPVQGSPTNPGVLDDNDGRLRNRANTQSQAAGVLDDLMDQLCALEQDLEADASKRAVAEARKAAKGAKAQQAQSASQGLHLNASAQQFASDSPPHQGANLRHSASVRRPAGPVGHDHGGAPALSRTKTTIRTRGGSIGNNLPVRDPRGADGASTMNDPSRAHLQNRARSPSAPLPPQDIRGPSRQQEAEEFEQQPRSPTRANRTQETAMPAHRPSRTDHTRPGRSVPEFQTTGSFTKQQPAREAAPEEEPELPSPRRRMTRQRLPARESPPEDEPEPPSPRRQTRQQPRQQPVQTAQHDQEQEQSEEQDEEQQEQELHRTKSKLRVRRKTSTKRRKETSTRDDSRAARSPTAGDSSSSGGGRRGKKSPTGKHKSSNEEIVAREAHEAKPQSGSEAESDFRRRAHSSGKSAAPAAAAVMGRTGSGANLKKSNTVRVSSRGPRSPQRGGTPPTDSEGVDAEEAARNKVRAWMRPQPQSAKSAQAPAAREAPLRPAPAAVSHLIKNPSASSSAPSLFMSQEQFDDGHDGIDSDAAESKSTIDTVAHLASIKKVTALRTQFDSNEKLAATAQPSQPAQVTNIEQAAHPSERKKERADAPKSPKSLASPVSPVASPVETLSDLAKVQKVSSLKSRFEKPEGNEKPLMPMPMGRSGHSSVPSSSSVTPARSRNPTEPTAEVSDRSPARRAPGDVPAESTVAGSPAASATRAARNIAAVAASPRRNVIPSQQSGSNASLTSNSSRSASARSGSINRLAPATASDVDSDAHSNLTDSEREGVYERTSDRGSNAGFKGRQQQQQNQHYPKKHAARASSREALEREFDDNADDELDDEDEQLGPHDDSDADVVDDMSMSAYADSEYQESATSPILPQPVRRKTSVPARPMETTVVPVTKAQAAAPATKPLQLGEKLSKGDIPQTPPSANQSSPLRGRSNTKTSASVPELAMLAASSGRSPMNSEQVSPTTRTTFVGRRESAFPIGAAPGPSGAAMASPSAVLAASATRSRVGSSAGMMSPAEAFGPLPVPGQPKRSSTLNSPQSSLRHLSSASTDSSPSRQINPNTFNPVGITRSATTVKGPSGSSPSRRRGSDSRHPRTPSQLSSSETPIEQKFGAIMNELNNYPPILNVPGPLRDHITATTPPSAGSLRNVLDQLASHLQADPEEMDTMPEPAPASTQPEKAAAAPHKSRRPSVERGGSTGPGGAVPNQAAPASQPSTNAANSLSRGPGGASSSLNRPPAIAVPVTPSLPRGAGQGDPRVLQLSLPRGAESVPHPSQPITQINSQSSLSRVPPSVPVPMASTQAAAAQASRGQADSRSGKEESPEPELAQLPVSQSQEGFIAPPLLSPDAQLPRQPELQFEELCSQDLLNVQALVDELDACYDFGGSGSGTTNLRRLSALIVPREVMPGTGQRPTSIVASISNASMTSETQPQQAAAAEQENRGRTTLAPNNASAVPPGQPGRTSPGQSRSTSPSPQRVGTREKQQTIDERLRRVEARRSTNAAAAAQGVLGDRANADPRVASALAKLAEAQVYKAAVRVYTEDGTQFKTIHVTSLMCAESVVALMMAKVPGAPEDNTWTLFEQFHDSGVERPLKDWEIVTDVLRTWERESTNALMVRRYGYKASLTLDSLKMFYPPVSGWLYVETKPTVFKRRYVELKHPPAGQHHRGAGGVMPLSIHDTVPKIEISNGPGKPPSYVCELANMDVYTLTRPRKRAPTKFGFALKAQSKMSLFDTMEMSFICFLCAESMEKMKEWVLALRNAKSHVDRQMHPELFEDDTPLGMQIGAAGAAAAAAPASAPAAGPATPPAGPKTDSAPSSAAAGPPAPSQLAREARQERRDPTQPAHHRIGGDSPRPNFSDSSAAFVQDRPTLLANAYSAQSGPGSGAAAVPKTAAAGPLIDRIPDKPIVTDRSGRPIGGSPGSSAAGTAAAAGTTAAAGATAVGLPNGASGSLPRGVGPGAKPLVGMAPMQQQ